MEAKKLSVIALEGIEVHAYHGVYKNERTHGNPYVVDIYLKADIRAAAQSDDLGDTVDYFGVYKIVLHVMDQPVQLLEHLADKMGQEILRGYPQVVEAKVRVRKIQPWAMDRCAQTYVETTFRTKS
ncbi:MAG: dihydroneopterin aldolase [Bacteroidota bacterium]